MDHCYFAHGGRELVVGGKLTILPGAVIEGLESPGSPAKAKAVADSRATTVVALREDFNALLAALREAGLMENGAPEPDKPETGDAE